MIRPREKFSPYFSFIKIGYNNAPKAIMVTPEAPVRAVKKAQTSNIAKGIPPGIRGPYQKCWYKRALPADPAAIKGP